MFREPLMTHSSEALHQRTVTIPGLVGHIGGQILKMDRFENSYLKSPKGKPYTVNHNQYLVLFWGDMNYLVINVKAVELGGIP